MSELANERANGAARRHLIDLWEASRERFASRLALVGPAHRLTYAEVGERVDRSAEVLQEMGVGPGVKVALFLPNDPAFVVAFMSVLKAGGVVCHIDPFLTAQELPRVLSLIQPDLAIFGDVENNTVAGVQQLLPSIRLERPEIDPRSVRVPPIEPEEVLNGVAGLFCTSGTTGIPKAVMLTHFNLTRNVASLLAHGRWDGHEVFGNPLPVWHISGAMVLSLLPIAMGATVVYLRRATPEAILKMVASEGITRFGGVPHMYAMLNRFRSSGRYDVSCCRSWITGGAPIPLTVEQEFEAKFPGRIRHIYGMLEASPGIASTLDERDYRAGEVGRALPGVEIEIRNPQGEAVDPGEEGEVFVRSGSVMKGYYRNPEATTAAIRDGWLNTGDVGTLGENGVLALSGRSKEIMIVAGQNVYPGEIEAVLSEHEAVTDVGVASVEDEVRGEEILAFVVTADAAVQERDLLAYCRRSLAAYKVPRRVVKVDEIPRTDSGKILRDRLIDKAPSRS